MLKSIFEAIQEQFSEYPWYVNIAYIAGLLFTLFLFFILLIAVVEITKTLFAADLLGLAFVIYHAISSYGFSSEIIFVIVFLCIAFFVLLFFLCCNEAYDGESIGWTIWNAFWGGVLNLCLLCCIFTVVLIPFASKAFHQNDRY